MGAWRKGRDRRIERSSVSLLCGASLGVLALLSPAGAATAADWYWDANGTTPNSGGTGAWDTNSSLWSPNNDGVSGPYTTWNNSAIDNAIFSGLNGTVTLGTPITVHSLTIDTGSTYTLTGSTLTLAGATPTITINGNATISSILAGNAGLTKAGAGALTLTGSNTFSGGVNVTAGVLSVSGDSSLGAASNGINLSSGAGLMSTGALNNGRLVTLLSGSSSIGGGVGSAHVIGAGGFSLIGQTTLSDDTNAFTGGVATDGFNLFFTSIRNLGEVSALGAPTTTANGAVFVRNASAVYTGDGDTSDRSWSMAPFTGSSTLRNQGSGTLTITGDITAGGGYTASVILDAQTADLALLGVISSNLSNIANRPFVFTGGGTNRSITLNDANTFGGAVTIQTVTVRANSLADQGVASSLGTGADAGTVFLNSGALSYIGAGSSTNRGLSINGSSSVLNDGTGALALSGAVAFLAGGPADTLTLGGGFAGANSLSGVISGNGNIVMNGAGTWALSGANTYTGATTVTSGTLQAGSDQAFGGAPNVLTVNGGTLDLNTHDLEVTSLTGTGGSVALNGADLTVNGATSTTYAGSITGSGGLLKRGTSTLTLTRQSTYTGATTINGGAVVLDFSAAGAPATNILSGSSALNMTGGSLTLTGAAATANSQSFNGLNVGAGNNRITVAAGGSMALDLGAITHTGGLLDFTISANSTVTTSNTDGALGWATVNGSDYAQVAANQVVAFTAYAEKDDAGAWQNGDVVADTGGAANTPFANTVTGDVQLGGLKYTAAASSTVNVGAGNRLGVDGTIIVASSVGNASQTISGGSITGAVGGGTLGVLDNSTGTGAFTIASTIVDNGPGTSFVKGGVGKVALTGANSYTGGTTISGGTLAIDSVANGGMASSIGASAAGSANLVLESGTLEYTGVGAGTTDRGFTLVNGGPSRTIQVDSGNLSFGGVVVGPDDAGFAKTGAGTLTLANAANTYTGSTTISGGMLSVNTLANGGQPSGIGASTSDSANLVIQTGGTLQYTGATASTDRGLTLNGIAGGAIDVTNAGAVLTIGGTIAGLGSAPLTKVGPGALIVSGINTYTGATTINGGTLQAGSTQAFGTPHTVTLADAAGVTLDLNGFNNKVGGLDGGGANGGVVRLGGATLTVGGSNVSFSGAITGAGGLTKDNSSTQTLLGCNNTYTGATNVVGGTLSVDCLANGGQASGIGASTSASANLGLNNGILAYTGGSVTIDRGITLFNTGAINVANAGAVLGISGPIVGGSLRKDGAGTLVLTGNNTYTGITTVTGGILRAGSINAIGKGALGLNDTAGVLVDLNNFDTSVSALNGGGAAGGNVTLGTATLTIASNSGAGNYAGAISGSGGLVKGGTFGQALTGCASSYTGSTAIKGGLLQVSCLTNGGANSAIGASSNAAGNLVLNGGTLSYIGTGDSTDRLFTLGAGSKLDASGSGAVVFTNTGAIAFVTPGANQTLTLGGANMNNNGLAAQITNNGAGVTSLIKNDAGTWILNNQNSTYTGVTTINGGVLGVDKLSNGGQASSIGASSNAAGNLVIGNTSTLRYTGAGDTTDRLFTLAPGTTFIESSGTGAIKFLNTGAVTLQTAGQARTIALGGTNTGDNTLGGSIGNATTGVTVLAKNDAGRWILTGTNTYTGLTNINGGTLQLGDGGTTGSIASATVNDFGALAFDRSNAYTYAGVVTGTGSLSQLGSGTTTLTGTNTYTGGTTIGGGVLQLGAGGTSGSILGDVTDNGELAFNRADTVTFGGLVSGSGAVTKRGDGVTILTADNSYAGPTNVDAGTLRINGDQSASTGLTTVNTGATLGGSGVIGGSVVVQNGGTLSPGNSPGTLTINGNLTLNATSNVNFELGQAGVVGGPLNDLINVGGSLTLDGVLNISVSPGGTFGPGIYRLFNYSGSLTDNGLAFGSTPGGNLAIQTSIAGQVNLTNSAGLALNFWDGPTGPQNDGVVQGGSGTWRLVVGGGVLPWTQADGGFNSDYAQDGFAVFSGAPGVVTVDDTGGAVRASGLQFAVDGYTIDGDELGLTGTQATVRVGDGSSAGAAMTATIASVLSGDSQLVKTDLGTLVLTGANTYTGGTAINGGTLRIASDAALGAASGGLSFNGGTLETTADVLSNRAIDLTGAGTFSTAPSTTLTLNGPVSGAGGLMKQGGGALVIAGDATHTGGTTISAGVLQIGAGGASGSLAGDILNNATLAFDRSDTLTVDGVISGSGALNQIGGGTTTLTGANSYTGATNVDAGALFIDGDQSFATGLTTVASGATLGGMGVIGGDVTVANGATFAPGGATAAPGELKILGSLTFSSGASIKYDFGQAGVVGGPLNDLTTVSQNLTLAGTLDVATTSTGSFDPGLYRVMSYGGTLNGTLAVGSIPSGTDFFLQTSVANQVNLVNTNGLVLNYWDGAAGTRNDGVIAGGDGVWQASADDSWTLDTGATNAPYTSGAFAVFAGAAGTVTIDRTQGAVNAAGLQFATGGYVLNGDPLNLVGTQATIRVGDGTASGAGMTATIDAQLTGAAGLTKSDLGTLVLTGANTYAGPTLVDAGTLRIDGDQSAATGPTTVNAGGTLRGAGIVGGGVTVADGGVLAAGGASPGTLTIKGDVTLNSGSLLDFRLGQANTPGGALNDLVEVGGNLTLDGVLNVSVPAGGSFGLGVYRLFDYAGGLTDNGLTLGSMPAADGLAIQTAVAHQVNLINGAGLDLNFWDGPGAQNDGAIQGGSGTWSAAAGPTMWTNSTGALNSDYAQASFAIFAGAAGTVTIDDTAGSVRASGLQFATDGYRITGDSLALVGSQSTIRVGDGSAASSGMTAAIEAPITGGAQLVKTDLGTLVLAGANTYAGGTAMNGGVVSVAEDANLGDAAGGLSFDGGALRNTAAFFTQRNAALNAGGGTFQTDADLTVFGVVSGAGGLTKSGGGALILGADNTYAGGTTIAGGTLQLGDGGTTGSIMGDVADNGTLAFDRSDAVGFGGAISGTGAVGQIGAGTTTLTGVNTYSGGTTISSGTLKGSATSFGSGAITDNAALVIDQPSDASFANAIDGTGSFTKTGAGRLTYAGVGALTGPTTVVAGTLAVNGSLAQSAVEVLSGAGLGGSGTVGATIIRTGGTVAPGASIGTLHIAGNLVLEGGSTYQVEVDPNSSASDLIAVTGSATIASGAGLNVTKTVAGNYRPGTVYTVLDASGGRTGTFGLSGEITDLSGFLALKDTYDANHAYLTVVQTNSIDGVAETPNQKATAGGLPAGGEVETAVLNAQDPAGARNLLDQLSGNGLVAIRGVLVNDSRLVRDMAVGRLRDVLCAEDADRKGADQGARQDACPTDTDRATAWGQGFGAWGHTDGNRNTGNVHRSTDGLMMGFDAPVAEIARLGAFAGYSHTDLELTAQTGGANVENYHLGAYGGVQKGGAGIRFGAAYTWQDVQTTRHVALPNLLNNLRASYDAGTVQAFGEAGYRADLGRVAVEPFLNAAYVSTRTGAFGERGGATALSTRAEEMHDTFTTLGARPSANLAIGSLQATIRGVVGWRHAFGEVTPQQTMAFAGGPDFVIQGAPIARDAGVAEVGLDMRIGSSGTVGLTYGGQYSAHTIDQTVSGRFTIRF